MSALQLEVVNRATENTCKCPLEDTAVKLALQAVHCDTFNTGYGQLVLGAWLDRF